jgi:peroxiredoxin Q/BCP
VVELLELAVNLWLSTFLSPPAAMASGTSANAAIAANQMPRSLTRRVSRSLARLASTVIEGREAPDFTLPDQDGNAVSLHDQRGKWVVVYFYPRADTPGCTTQACGVRDRSADYEKAGVTVLGVSPDPVSAVKKFADKNSLRFRLLADEAHSVAEDWGVWAEKSMYGKKYWGVVRATFIIDPKGKIARVFPKVSPKTHDDQVLGALAELQAD